jgi:nucleoside-diphosphate-sugar epimerase
MKWDGEQLETFHIDVNVDNLHGNANKAMDFPVVPFVRFLGYYLSEGSLKVKSNGTYEVHLSNSSPTILSDMMQCVRDLGYNPYFDASSSHGISFSSRVMVEYLSKFGLSGDKYIPREVKDLSPDILAHLFETLNHGDGARDRNTYYTTSPTLADDFGELCVKLGKSYTVSRGDIRNPNWAPLYSVYYCDKQETVLHEYPDVETYQGMVYCVEVPNHVIYVRRNGKASWVGNCDMGGIGFIEGNKLQCMLSVQMSTNMLRFAAENYVDRYFYSSSACAYPVHLQTDAGDVTALSEDMAYPANSEDGYGWEKLFTERMCRHFMEETGMETHVARYHNIYGTETSWNDGREKAPAAIARKVAEAVVYGYNHINIWGDGSQARSFCWINDCIDGSLQLMDSSIYAPVNIGSDRLITVNELVTMVEGFAEVELERRYNLDAPKGVAGRNSDNTFVRENLGWEPKIALEDGMKELYFWILEKVQHNKLNGIGPVVNEY